MTYELKNDEPGPAPAKGGVAKYPWNSMKVGQHFFVPRTDYKNENYRPKPNAALNMKIATRKRCENGITGIKIWRIA